MGVHGAGAGHEMANNKTTGQQKEYARTYTEHDISFVAATMKHFATHFALSEASFNLPIFFHRHTSMLSVRENGIPCNLSYTSSIITNSEGMFKPKMKKNGTKWGKSF